MIRAVLFDYGGTLVLQKKDFNEAKEGTLRSVYECLDGRGLTLSYEEFGERYDALFRRYSALEKLEHSDVADAVKYKELVDGLFPGRSEVWRRRAAREATDAFWTVVIRDHPLRKNARRTLSRLKAMDLKLAIVSNHHSHEALVKHIEDLGIASRFSCVISSVRSGTRKPDRRIFESCLSSLNVQHAEDAVFVGDSPENDIEGARSVGMHSILITDDEFGQQVKKRGSSRTRADFTVRDLAEIPEIVSKL